jgi:hypothetical protein
MTRINWLAKSTNHTIVRTASSPFNLQVHLSGKSLPDLLCDGSGHIMAASRLIARRRPLHIYNATPSKTHLFLHAHEPRILPSCRTFTSSSARYQHPHRKDSFRARLGTALRNTKIEWYWVPASAGVAFVGGLQSYRMYATAQEKKDEEDNASLYSDDGSEEEPGKKPKKRKRIKPEGPWYVLMLAT